MPTEAHGLRIVALIPLYELVNDVLLQVSTNQERIKYLFFVEFTKITFFLFSFLIFWLYFFYSKKHCVRLAVFNFIEQIWFFNNFYISYLVLECWNTFGNKQKKR